MVGKRIDFTVIVQNIFLGYWLSPQSLSLHCLLAGYQVCAEGYNPIFICPCKNVSVNINNNSYNNGSDNNYAKINKTGGICKSL